MVIHVSPEGSDSAGTAASPLQTLKAAQSRVRELAGMEPVTVLCGDGINYLDEPLVLTPEDGGVARDCQNAGDAGGADSSQERHSTS